MNLANPTIILQDPVRRVEVHPGVRPGPAAQVQGRVRPAGRRRPTARGRAGREALHSGHQQGRCSKMYFDL